ncbi:MAG: substrate-binding domain-containing protein [Streptosporangiales bacterium]|nr:substrate-binding domain-containing protein [Streptosporangiales bacterium]
MSLPEIVSHEEWLAARRALLEKEKEATRARDALNAERRRLPRIEAPYDPVVRGPRRAHRPHPGRHRVRVQLRVGQRRRAGRPAPADLSAVHDLTKRLEIPDAKGASGDLYIFLPKSLDNPYWDDARKGMNAMAKELGVKAEFLGPRTTDVNQQVQIFESALSRKPKGIAVSPNDPNALKDVIARADQQGIKMIAWDSPVPESDVLGYIGTDNTAAGKTLGDKVVQQIGGEGEIAVVLGSLGAVNSQERLAGLKDDRRARSTSTRAWTSRPFRGRWRPRRTASWWKR